MKMRNLINEDSNSRLSTPIQMGGYAIAVDKKNGTVYLWDRTTATDSLRPGTETIRLTSQYLSLLYKLSQKKNTI